MVFISIKLKETYSYQAKTENVKMAFDLVLLSVLVN